MTPDLLVNIDHVATLRNARKEQIPDPLAVAKECLDHGAAGIVYHLREDRRHIIDEDVRRLSAELDCKQDFELSIAKEIVDFCCEIKPNLATLVPEKREEITTEGGLDLRNQTERLSDAVKQLKDNNITVSFFMDPNLDQIKMAKDLGADCIELHTGNYANGLTDAERVEELARLSSAAKLSNELGMRVHAGHGLDLQNYQAFAHAVPELKEVSIGFYLIARSVFVGIGTAVSEMLKAMRIAHLS